MTIQYIDRAAPFALDPAVALLGNEREGLSVEGLNLRGYVRDRTTPANNFLGGINSLLTYSDPSTKWIYDKDGKLTSGTALRCEYDRTIGDPLGVRVEPQQATNLCTYSKFAGAVAGAPGTAPTGWTSFQSGSAAMAVEAADVGNQLAFSGNGGRYFLSKSVTLAANTTYVATYEIDVSSTGTILSDVVIVAAAPSGATSTLLLDGVTAVSTTPVPAGKHIVGSRIVVGATGGTLTYRVGVGPGANSNAIVKIRYPQIEPRSTRSSYIPTDASAADRAADDITLPLAKFPWNGGVGLLRVNGAVAAPFLNGASDALDIAATVAAAGATHLVGVKWVPTQPIASLAGIKAALAADAIDQTLLVVGDSTGNDGNEWVAGIRDSLGAAYPSYSVKYALYNGTSEAYPAPSTSQTGTGANTLTIWNASVAGAGASYFTGSKFTTAIGSVDPDAIVINLGENHYAQDAATRKSQFETLLSGIQSTHPGVPITLVLQEPRRDDDLMSPVIDTLLDIAAEFGTGQMNVYVKFLAAGKDTSLYVDAIHPSTDGTALFVAAFTELFDL